MKCGLLGNEAGKGQLLDLGRMFANDAKTVWVEDSVDNLYECAYYEGRRGIPK